MKLPLHVTEELCLEQRLGERRAIDGDERRTAAGAAGVDQARDDFLARPALAGDQNLRVAARRVEDFFLESEDGRTRTDEFGGLHRTLGCHETEVAVIASF